MVPGVILEKEVVRELEEELHAKEDDHCIGISLHEARATTQLKKYLPTNVTVF